MKLHRTHHDRTVSYETSSSVGSVPRIKPYRVPSLVAFSAAAAFGKFPGCRGGGGGAEAHAAEALFLVVRVAAPGPAPTRPGRRRRRRGDTPCAPAVRGIVERRGTPPLRRRVGRPCCAWSGDFNRRSSTNAESRRETPKKNFRTRREGRGSRRAQPSNRPT